MKNFDERVRTCPITILKKQIYFIFNSNLSNSNFATLYYTLNKSLRNPIYDIQIYFGNLEKNTWFQYSPRFLFPHNNVGKDFSERSFSCSRFAARPSSTWKNGGNSVEYPGSPPPSERRRGYLGERLEAEVVRRGGGEVGFSFCSWPGGGGGGGKWRGNIGESLLLEFAAPWEENKIQASSDCCFQLNPPRAPRSPPEWTS